jgi:hypothetical protein
MLSKDERMRRNNILKENTFVPYGNKYRLNKTFTQEQKDKISMGLIEYNAKKPVRICSLFNCNTKHYGKGYCKKHYEYHIKTSTPHSRRDLPLALQVSMNNVRVRDKNTCQWYNCTKSGRGINVHHIFPKSEYPQLQYEEKYMICYCTEHHKQWHKARGDKYHRLIR